MSTPTLTAQNDWYRAAMGILNGSIPKEKETFYASANALYQFVAIKNQGRWCSKKIHDEQLRNQMIEKLFKIYVKDAPLYQICQSKFMRKFIKHDQSNDQYLDFIRENIVPVQISNLPHTEKLIKNFDAHLWLQHLSATICEPQALKDQKHIYDSIPDPEFRKILSKERTAIGAPLKQAVLDGWIDAKEIEQICEALQQVAKENPSIELTKEKAVAHFIYRYHAVIASGEKYGPQFAEAIVKGLSQFKVGELVIQKKSIAKIE